MATVREWLAARRPLWAIYPTRRLAVVVLCLAFLWLFPGNAGMLVATALGCIAIAVAVD